MAIKIVVNKRQTRIKIARNSVLDWHLLPVGQQMAIKSSVSNNFWSISDDSINIFDCCLSGVFII